MMDETFGNILTTLLLIMAVCVVASLLGLFALARSIRRLRVPPDADFFTTMRYVPITLVILLDMLDFGLDIFAAPISFIVLDRMGLRGLRNKAAIEALIPFTQPIPTFTLGWIAARTLNLGEPPGHAPYGSWEEREYRPSRRQPTIIDMDDPRSSRDVSLNRFDDRR
jgi:hypothetical protein